MESRSPTLSARSESPDSPSLAPIPPPHLFRTIKRLPCAFNVQHGVFLCLPRTIDAELETSFDALVKAVEYNGASALRQKYVDLLPHLRIVKTGTWSQDVRRETSVLETLHLGREHSSLHIGSIVAKAQITKAPASSWVCEYPVFGPTLAEFGAAYGAIPSWFLAHIFLGLLDALAFIHADGVAHRLLDASNVVLNLHPRSMHHRYRGYPDVLLTDFVGATALQDVYVEGDVRKVLRIMEEMVVKWSDGTPFLALAAREGVMETDDPMMLVLRDVRELLWSDEPPALHDVRSQFVNRLIDLRHTGPEHIPRPLLKLLHADLATEDEIEHALREPTVLKFDANHEDFVKIIGGEPMAMGMGIHAGMRTSRIFVMRFTARKKDFARIGQEELEEDVETNYDGMFEDENVDMHASGETDDMVEGGDDMDVDAEGEPDDME